MLESKTTRIVLGAAIWLGAAGAFAMSAPARALPAQASNLWRYAAVGGLEVRIACPPGTGELALHDPVYEQRGIAAGADDGRLIQVGEVIGFTPAGPDGVPEARIIIYSTDRARLGPASRFEVAFASGSPRWILETLLPDEDRAKVFAEIEAFLAENEDLILETAALVGDEVVAEGRRHLESNFADVLKRHETELAAALEKHGAQWNDKIVPALKKNVWPVAREKTQPILQQCVEDIWEKLPVTSTVWGALKSRVKESVGVQEVDPRWRADLVALIVETLEAHGPEFQQAVVETAKHAAQDAELRAAVGEMAAAALSDPEVLRVLKTIFRDAVTVPFDTRQLIEKMLDDPRVRERIERLEHRLEPRLFKIAQLVTLADDGRSIDPDLARVLRRTVFNKDRRLVVAELVAPAPGDGVASDGALAPVASGHLFRAALAGSDERASARPPRKKREEW